MRALNEFGLLPLTLFMTRIGADDENPPLPIDQHADSGLKMSISPDYSDTMRQIPVLEL